MDRRIRHPGAPGEARELPSGQKDSPSLREPPMIVRARIPLLAAAAMTALLAGCGGETDRSWPDHPATVSPVDTMLFPDAADSPLPEGSPGTPTPP
jgi:hypothetical protein